MCFTPKMGPDRGASSALFFGGVFCSRRPPPVRWGDPNRCREHNAIWPDPRLGLPRLMAQAHGKPLRPAFPVTKSPLEAPHLYPPSPPPPAVHCAGSTTPPPPSVVQPPPTPPAPPAFVPVALPLLLQWPAELLQIPAAAVVRFGDRAPDPSDAEKEKELLWAGFRVPCAIHCGRLKEHVTEHKRFGCGRVSGWVRTRPSDSGTPSDVLEGPYTVGGGGVNPPPWTPPPSPSNV